MRISDWSSDVCSSDLIIDQLGLRLVYAMDTHIHADHITALGDLRNATACVTVMGEFSKADCVSERVRDGRILNVDGIRIQAIHTPGDRKSTRLNSSH